MLYRDERGYTQVRRASDIERVREFMQDGALLGDLWTEGQFGVGDPLVAAGEPGIAGVARLIRDEDASSTAEVAIIIADDWQHQRVARLILERPQFR